MPQPSHCMVHSAYIHTLHTGRKSHAYTISGFPFFPPFARVCIFLADFYPYTQSTARTGKGNAIPVTIIPSVSLSFSVVLFFISRIFWSVSFKSLLFFVLFLYFAYFILLSFFIRFYLGRLFRLSRMYHKKNK
jgi:hypothetical protein